MAGIELTSSSYEKEEAALLTGLDWTRANCPTECISTWSIQSGAHDTQYICQRLENRKGPNVLIWVLVHKGMRHSKATAELSKAVASMTDTPP